MRKFSLMLAAGIIFCCCGCKSDKSLAEQAAYNYSLAMANYQVDEASKYATEETQNTILKTAKRLVEKVDSSYIKSDTPATIEITYLEMTSDTSAVATYHKVTPTKNFTGTVEVRKRDGEWKAHVVPRVIPDEYKPADLDAAKTKGNDTIRDYVPPARNN